MEPERTLEHQLIYVIRNTVGKIERWRRFYKRVPFVQRPNILNAD